MTSNAELIADAREFRATSNLGKSMVRELDKAMIYIRRLVNAVEFADARIAELERGVEITGATSDGYHTFDELYEYRMLYNAHAAHGWLAAGIPVVKSWKHSDGEPCFGGGWFIVTATLPSGQVSNHYEAEHWGLFKVPEVELPPEYDGHTPHDAALRLRIEAEHASRGLANEAEARIAEAAKLHRKVTVYSHEDACPDTSEEHRGERHSGWGADPGEFYCLDMIEEYICEPCSEGKDPWAYWPCPTAVALGLNEVENEK